MNLVPQCAQRTNTLVQRTDKALGIIVYEYVQNPLD